MKLLIVVHHRLELWNVPKWFGERLHKEFPQLEVVQRTHYDGVEEYLRDAEVVFTLSLRPEQYVAAKNLRWIHTPTAAVHQFMFPELVNSGVVLTNSREVHGPVVAEHVIALIFALAKRIPQAALLQKKGVWGQEPMWNEPPHLREIAGATLGLNRRWQHRAARCRNGLGAGHARYRGARACEQAAAEGRREKSSPSTISMNCLGNPITLFWPLRSRRLRKGLSMPIG